MKETSDEDQLQTPVESPQRPRHEQRRPTKEDLRLAAGLSTATIAKMGKDGNVTTDVLARICTELNFSLEQVAEIAAVEAQERRQ